MLPVIFKHLHRIGYQQAWDYQESLLKENVDIKTWNRTIELEQNQEQPRVTQSHFLLCEHEPVFTLGKADT